MRAVISAKPLPPGEPHGDALVTREEAEAGDGLVGRAETEEERRARRDRLEAVRRGLPEVDLVRRPGAVQSVREPAEVGVGDEAGRRGHRTGDRRHDYRPGVSDRRFATSPTTSCAVARLSSAASSETGGYSPG